MSKTNGKRLFSLTISIFIFMAVAWNSWISSTGTFVKYDSFTKFMATRIKAFNLINKDIDKTDRPTAKRSRPFVFVRTHKTGSSTIADVVMKYVISNNTSLQTAALFPWPFVGGYPGRIRFKFLKPEGDVVSALWQHQRFDADELHRHMPEGTRYITVIREPWSHFQSTYNFYDHSFPKSKMRSWNCAHMPITFVLKGRKMDPVSFMHECARTLNKSIPWYFRLKNNQAHDLGFDPMLEDQVEIERQLKSLETNMDLIMINEYMKESLILLKDLLNLNWSDIVFYSKNVKKYRKMELTANNDRMTFLNHNQIDIALYRHFNATFWKKVDLYGRKKMEDDMLKFDNLLIKYRTNRTKKLVKLSSPRRPEILEVIPKEMKDYMMQNAGDCPYS